MPWRIVAGWFVAVFFALMVSPTVKAQSPDPEPEMCYGQNGSIEVPRVQAGIKRLQIGDLASIIGGYCENSNGRYQSAGLDTRDVRCSVGISPTGVFSIRVGEHSMQVVPANGTYMSSTMVVGSSPTSQTYGVMASDQKVIPDGTEMITAEVDVQFKRVVVSTFTRSTYVNNVKTDIETMSCAFHRRTEAASMIPGSIYYASAEHISKSLVGVHHGLAPSEVDGDKTDVPCSVEVTSSGNMILNAPVSSMREGAFLTATGKLEGRLWDSIIYEDNGITINARERADVWQLESSKWHGVILKVDAESVPISAQGGNGDLLNAEETTGTCRITPPTGVDEACTTEACIAEKDGLGAMSCPMSRGNPINISNGNKFQRELDFAGGGNVQLRFERFYNSNSHVASGSMGSNWRTTFDRTLSINTITRVARAYRQDGKVVTYRKIGEEWRGSADVNSILSPVVGGVVPDAAWSIFTEDNATEFYNAAGKLVQISNRESRVQKLKYDLSGRLITVADNFGRMLTFGYDVSNRIESMKDPIGGMFYYSYDSSNNLAVVTAPGSPLSTRRKYLYEHPTFPHALTGLEDENGKRYATWHYDTKGRAFSSEHAGGVDKYQLTFVSDYQTTVVDPRSSSQSLTYRNVLGVRKYAGETQVAGSGCAEASRATTFDPNGNFDTRTDFNGNVVKYVYDLKRNLELVRTEGFGTSVAKTVSTRWHSKFRLKTEVAAPKMILKLDYDPAGNLLTRTEQATTDPSGGSGFTATKIAQARKWVITYDGNGNLRSKKGPRTDVDDTVYFTYDDSGNLQTVTNAVGHVTTYLNYDSRGFVGQIISPNKVKTDLLYNPRGLVISRKISADGTSQIIKYEYDGVGQITKVTFPNDGFIKYVYDDAHRLTDLLDNLGNTIHYKLDSSGNRVSEQIRDPDGVLTRQIAREYDALNRLEVLTGAAQ